MKNFKKNFNGNIGDIFTLKICNPQSAIRNSQNGFTLLELMVSFLIVGVIVVIITGAMRLSFDAVDKGEERIDSLERIRTSMNIINSQIQSQFPLKAAASGDSPGREEDGEKKYYFRGERESMQFSTNYSIWGGQKGYVAVKYKVESDDSGKQMLTASENIIGIDSSRETKLFNALDTIYFEYFFNDPTEEIGSWVEEWTDNSDLPEKVKLHIIYGGKDFSMIIPVRTAGSPKNR